MRVVLWRWARGGLLPPLVFSRALPVPFSAFWLRSSVVSVLISVKTDIHSMNVVFHMNLCALGSPSRLRAAPTDVPGLALPPGDVDPLFFLFFPFLFFLSTLHHTFHPFSPHYITLYLYRVHFPPAAAIACPRAAKYVVY
jgi:hypothetical protein